MEFLLDPGIWVSLLTLIILEIVLGIDNLVFIAILAEKLPPEQRDKARVIGLSLALLMRLGLLFIITWLVTLTRPLITVLDWTFSGRDLILLFGGLFLVYKAVTELHEKIEGKPEVKLTTNVVYAGFTAVVAQIVILDAVFSLDSVITAIGMVDNINVMMVAMVVAMVVMLLASKPLMTFVNRHPTVVILCLSFLLLIGISLIAEGFGFHIPKGYIYSGIGVAIAIEAFNQFGERNAAKHEAKIPLRHRTADSTDALLQQVFRLRWRHARERAAHCAVLAQRTGLSMDDAMLAGLLQDIGSLPLLSELEHWPQVSRDAATLEGLCESLSGNLGALILTRWQLPPAVVECARQYGQWQREHDGPADLADLVLLASALQAAHEPEAPLPAQMKLGLEQPLATLRQELADELSLWKRLLA